ncbi:putative ancient ubiquitous protein 1 [Blattamonas nauphoetae]|uniref:Ancient ubiquitous protein 1 n=1 Tax=Blattamonas nauphoetae TaxID=2049346 RepID=A0ABQ9YA48_9EUKA|nr:putative ancient ubiquitous protein 1 [Blattamonas nauphoetae]
MSNIDKSVESSSDYEYSSYPSLSSSDEISSVIYDDPNDDPDFNHPGEPPLIQLFNKSRIVPNQSIKSYILLALWAPFGLIIGSLRFVLLFIIAMPLLMIFSIFNAEPLYWKTVMRAVGFKPRLTGNIPLAKPEEASILVCNHVTDIDAIAFFGIVPTTGLIELTTRFLRPLVDWAKELGWKVIVVIRETDPAKRHLTRENLLRVMDSEEGKKRQLFIHGEGATTNGHVGLLRYNKFVFTLNKPVQPLALRVYPHIPINIDCPSRNMFPSLFAFCFCPHVTYEFEPLPVQKRKHSESAEDFAFRCQKMTADALGLCCTTYSYKHKNKLKRVVR